MTLTDQLLTLERQLLTRQTRTDPAALTALLTPDFREFGASGRIFTREAILTLLQTETDFTPPELTQLWVPRTHPRPGSRYGSCPRAMTCVNVA